MGFVKLEDTPICEENGTPLSSSFVNRQPKCAIYVDSATQNTIVRITNLVTTQQSQPFFYGVRVLNGLRNGPASRTITAGSCFCMSYINSQFTTYRERAFVTSLGFSPVFRLDDDSISISNSPQVTNELGKITVSFKVYNQIPSKGTFNLFFPAQNKQIYSQTGLTTESPVSIFPSTKQELALSGYYIISGQVTKNTLDLDVDDWIYSGVGAGEDFEMNIYLNNDAVIEKNSVITIVLSQCKMPPTLAPLEGFFVKSQDKDFNPIELGYSLTLTNKAPNTDSSGQSAARIVANTGILEKNAVYEFQIYTVGSIPKDGYFTLKVPQSVQFNQDDPAATMVFTCQIGCQSNSVKAALDRTDISQRTLLFQGVYPTDSAYQAAPGPIIFSISGFTNPASITPAQFQWNSYAFLENQGYQIDYQNNLYIQAVQGTCSIQKMYATDGNTKMYGVATNWTVVMSCEHPIQSDYGLQMFFPTDLLVISTTNCEVGLQNTGYSCVADSNARTITLFAFTNSVIGADVPFTFTFNSLRNSPVTGLAYTVNFSTQTSNGGKIDLGSYTIPKTYFTYGTIWQFSVIPSSLGVGQFPVFYNFTVQPSGEIPIGSYFELTLPSTVLIYDELSIEKQCSYGLLGFTNTGINCQVTPAKRMISILSGFTYKNTTSMLKGNAMIPPIIKFSIPFLQNPRTMTYTDVFGITIFNSASQAIYTWNNTYQVTSNGVNTADVLKGPVVRMSSPATPQSVVYNRTSTQNGNLTTYMFTVTPTNFLTEGDQITLTLPFPVFFTQQSQVNGVSKNLRYNQTAKVSQDLTTITITLLLPIKFRMLQAGSVYVIKAGEAFQFNITNIRNPVSFQPTTQSMSYSASTAGNMIERLTFSPLLQITNNQPGQFNVSQTSFMPQDFRPSFANNYTLVIKPINYEQNMRIVITIPKEISFASNSISCNGLAGTDVQNLACSLNITGKQITITNAVTFQKANPGTIKILLSQLKNPSSNILTSSLGVQTYTANGFLIDDLSSGLQVNFFCQYPCQNCNSKINTQCTQCYQNGDYSIFFNSTCLIQCPFGYINTTTNNCTACSKPCASCKNDKVTCTSCIDGYRLGQNKCLEIVYWPFPFAIFGIICFLVVALSEIITKTASKFKEAYMALLSLAELGSWVTLTVFLYFRLGYLGYSFIGCAASVLFALIINLVFIGIHQKLIIPNSLVSYKRVLEEHKCVTYLIFALSYIISYRFSLLSVSYLFKKSTFSGDLSLLNQRHFNRLSLVYVLISYPLMMLSIAYFVYTDGIFSYAGFVSIEVVAISTVMFCMMAVDAMTGCRCNTPREKRAYQSSKVSQGADYESEDEQPGKRLVKKRKEGGDEFGADEDIQINASDTMNKLKGTQVFDVRSNASIIDEETKRQIAMLEELARQMREEKEQLRLEKDRIERERHLMLSDKDQQLAKMQNYLQEYQNQTKVLKGQVENVQKSKAQLISQVQDKLNEGVEYNKKLLEQQKLLSKKAYRDIEGEMEDYDPVDEAEQDEEDSVIEDGADLPQPVAGQINYFRRLDGDEQYWLQQITPRAGGDSIMGQHDRDDEGQYQIMANKVAHYDTGTVPPSRHNREEYMMRSDASYSQINMVRMMEDAEVYRHQDEAQMEVDSDKGGPHSVQEYFQNENAHFAVEDPRTPLTQKVQYMARKSAEFEQIDDKLIRDGSERHYLAQEQAAKGMTEPPRSQYAGSTQQYVKNDDAIYGNLASEGSVLRQGTPVQYLEGNSASAGKGTSYDRDPKSTQQQYIAREAATRDNVSGQNVKEETLRMYQLDRASQGRTSSVEKSEHQRGYTQQPAEFGTTSRLEQNEKQRNFQQSPAEFGKTSEYDRNAIVAQNFRPVQQVLEDKSGHSESSEGIVDHNPFSQVKDDNINNKQQAKQQARQATKQDPNLRQAPKTEQKHSQQLSNNQAPGKRKKTIIYSDKSESSIDDMMGDTPSNYNIPNGRLDGKSLGLKAILLHAQNHTGRDLDNAQRKAGGSPRAAQSNNQFGLATRSNENEERKFVNNLHQRQGAANTLDTSHDGGWSNLNQPLGSKRTQVIGEDSADERTSGQQKKKSIKTNKQFAEPAPGRVGVNGIPKQSNQTPKPGQQQPQLNKVKTNNFL